LWYAQLDSARAGDGAAAGADGGGAVGATNWLRVKVAVVCRAP